MIEDGMTIGLGGGVTVAFLIDEFDNGDKEIVAVMPSSDTEELCQEHHVPVLPVESFWIWLLMDVILWITILMLLREKIVSAMPKHYVFLADESKIGNELEFRFMGTLEVVRSARAYMAAQLRQMVVDVTIRRSLDKAAVFVGDNGGYIMQVDFSKVKSCSDTVSLFKPSDGSFAASLAEKLDKMKILRTGNS